MRKILYLATEDWFFASHFLPMARTARRLGFEVVVATQISGKEARITDEGLRLIPLDTRRGEIGWIEALRYIVRVFRTVRAELPDIVHCIALRPTVLGGFAAKLAGANKLLLAPTGLGYLWTVHGFVVSSIRAIVRMTVGWWLAGPRTHYLFENRDDPREFGLDPDGPNVSVVAGAGVAQEDFPFTPEPPAPPVKVAVVSRMIWSKGIADAVEAVRRARNGGVALELDLFGEPDLSNPQSIPVAVLQGWSQEEGIQWNGRTDNVARVWREHHIALYLSRYREGLPRTIVEAAASGRPIITTSISGCRDVVRDGKEGFLIEPGDIDSAVRAIAKLADDASLRQRMGRDANLRFHDGFTESSVMLKVAEIYRSLGGASGG